MSLFNWLSDLQDTIEKFIDNSGPKDVAKEMKPLADIMLEDFAKPKQTWSNMNDTVMGGKSETGSFRITEEGFGVLSGNVVDVPKLKAPGFITVASKSKWFKRDFPDVRNCKSLAITSKSTEKYEGYYISFGIAHTNWKSFAFGYKAPFKPSTSEFTTIKIPFNQFSSYWDDKTGKTLKSCADNKLYCPDKWTLRDMKTISLWGEGVKGKINLQVKNIMATDCAVAVN